MHMDFVGIDLSNKKKLYNIFKIKKSSGFRWIYDPKPILRNEQNKLLKPLSKLPISDYCFAFRKGYSIKDAARIHINSEWIISLDIKDFFPSITKKHLLSLGLSDYECELVTYNGKLVQGTSVSPLISNIVISPIINRVAKVLCRHNVRLSAYADDITISAISGKPKHLYVNYINDVLYENNFKLNKRKTKFMFKNQSMKILGCNINNGITINRNKRKELKNKIKYENSTDRLKGLQAYYNWVMK